MSYLVLARKWRPQTFADVVGQRPVVRTLQNALKRGRVAHAMLFSGVRGVGKTTLARIMAKALNCESTTEEPPCNQCGSCREVTAGTAIDLHEIDGASNRGIQEIRELKENIRFFPTRSRFKIIIIDEVHMLTTEAFNALLKTLEEPPAHVYFMFATTELHKIPVTILSRCQRYELKRVPFAELAAFFKKIAAAEQVTISDAALDMITREAEGSVRDGLSLLDQIFSFCGSEVTDEDVRQVLGLVDQRIMAELSAALLAGDVSQSLEILDRAYTVGLDLKRFTNDLLAYFRALLICKTSPQPEALLDLADQELQAMKETAAAHTSETLYNLFQLLLKGAEAMQYSSHPRLVLEMSFIKAAQTGQITPVASLLARLDTILETEIGAGGQSGNSVANGSSGGFADGGGMIREPRPPAYADTKKTASTPPHQKDKSDPPSMATEKAPHAADKHQLREVRRHWEDFVSYVKERKQWMAHVLTLAAGIQREGKSLVIRFDHLADCRVLQEPANLKLLTEYAQDFFQQELQVQLSGQEPAAGEGAEGEVSPQEERRALGNEPLVQMATEIFDGQIGGIRTGPRSR